MFCRLNGADLDVEPDEAVTTMLAVAAGEMDEDAMTAWLRPRIRPGVS